MTQRLPTPGSDEGNWGSILNGFLGASHDSQGNLLPAAVTTAGALTQSTADSTYINQSQLGTTNGVATLTGTTLTSSQLPGSVVTTSQLAAYVPFESTAAPSYYMSGLDATGATDITAAFAAAYTALGGDTGSGTIVLPRGTFKVSSALQTINAPQIGVVGAGKGITTLLYYGNTVCLNATNPNFIENLGVDNVSAPFVGFTIDTTHAGSSAIAFEYGDRPGASIDISINNKTTNGGYVGAWFNNRYGWCERMHARLDISNHSTLYKFDSNCANGASYGYGDWELFCTAYASQNGVVLGANSSQSGPWIYSGTFAFKGNFSPWQYGGNGAVTNTGIAINLVSATSYIADEIHIACETDNSGTGHQSMKFTSGSGIRGYGEINFISSGPNWTASNGSSNSNNIAFTGLIFVQNDPWWPSNQYPGGQAVIGSWTEFAGYASNTVIYLNGGNMFVSTLVSGAQALTLANKPTQPMRFRVVIHQPASGAAGTVSSWPWKWPSGSAPALSAANNASDVIDVFTPDGINYYGTLLGLSYA